MPDETQRPNNVTTQVLGRYQLLKRIGRGGMGDVWLAEDPRLHRQVAIKTLPVHNQENQEFSQRFEREAQAAAALGHPHILPVHDFGEQPLPNGSVMTYIVMPYITGGSLAEKIEGYQQRQQLMPMNEALLYLAQAAEAIDFAHSRGIVHRDIKPGNMLLRNDGWLFLTDFGIARILSGYEQLTQQGVGFGTPEYMAPEQAQGRAEPASDNYSLAVLAYQLFAGRVPFNADTSYAITIQHIMTPPPSPRAFNPAITPALERALLHGLDKQPAQRPASARELVGEFQRAIANAPFENTYAINNGFPTQPRQNDPVSEPNSATLVKVPFTSPQQSYPVPESQPGTLIAPPPPPDSGKGLSRRQVLIGGGSAAVVLLGASFWELSRRRAPNPIQSGSHTTTTVTSAPAATTSTQNTSAPIVIQGKHNKPISTLAWSPKQNVLVSAGDQDDGLIYLWDINTLVQQQQSPQEKAMLKVDNVSDMLVVWSPTGDIVAIANAEATAIIDSAQITVYKSDFSDYAPGFSSNFALSNAQSFDGLAWGPDYFYTVHNPFSLSNFNMNTKDQLLVWDPKNPQKPVSSIALTNLFMTSSDDIYDLGNNKFVDVATNPLILKAQANGAMRVTLGTHEGILMGDITMVGGQAQWKQVGLFKFNETDQYAPADVGAISWASFGQHLAAIQQCLSKPAIVKVFDFDTKTYQQFAQHTNANGGLTTIAWNPTSASQLLAGGSADGKIDIWNYSHSRLPTMTLTPPASVSGIVKSLAWSADGAWLAAAYSDLNASLVIWKM